MIGSIFLYIIAMSFPTLIIWAIVDNIISSRRYDKAVAALHSTSKQPCLNGEVFIVSGQKRYKVGCLYTEAWLVYNEEEQVAVWSQISLDRQFKDLSERISQYGVQISENVHITPCQIDRVLLENVIKSEQ